ncbi:MAG: triose-phosphate isomerase [Proteobacteria bacterium]|nr:MAG: triose-phosphate isomerase [Pseudomonadota bacterium]
MQRKAFIAANWKMHTTLVEACTLASAVARAAEGLSDREVMLAPPFTVISEVAHLLQNTTIILAGQNVCWEPQGAFTGEISPVMLKDSGARAAIIGHSERRHLFGETDALINKRLKGAIAHDLIPVFCIGETLDERESGNTFSVLEKQVREGLADIAESQMGKMVIAYEPVWAIGTGKTASKEQAQDAHAFIRGLIERLYEKGVAENLRIVYGGSVKPGNVDELMAQTDIDGALVGGAALDAESFGRIIHFK